MFIRRSMPVVLSEGAFNPIHLCLIRKWSLIRIRLASTAANQRTGRGMSRKNGEISIRLKSVQLNFAKWKRRRERERWRGRGKTRLRVIIEFGVQNPSATAFEIPVARFACSKYQCDAHKNTPERCCHCYRASIQHKASPCR